MSNPITQGYGENQKIITKGYGVTPVVPTGGKARIPQMVQKKIRLEISIPFLVKRVLSWELQTALQIAIDLQLPIKMFLDLYNKILKEKSAVFILYAPILKSLGKRLDIINSILHKSDISIDIILGLIQEFEQEYNLASELSHEKLVKILKIL